MARCYENSVFINCPFDPAYRPLFEAVAFATCDCGFYLRSALEVDDSSEVRIQKIIRIIRECRLAIHDISRTQLDRDTGLPRFNMPLELGIFIGAKAFGGEDHARKAAIVLDTERYRYQKYISDIAGQDIRAHRRRPADAIREVRCFLATHCPDGVILPGGDRIVERYAQFCDGLADTCARLHVDPRELTFRDLSTLMVAWMETHPLFAAALN
ncbi:MAG TPA: hypothetical protein VM759_02715 [Longimicrobium sp.]|nr:hypothetical protein [Longimicrobium sp.]